MNQLIDAVEQTYRKARVPQFRIGDTVDVACRIVEGDKERTQIFNGTVIARRGRGMGEMFAVRRIVNNEGVERIFMLHSPHVLDITVRRSGKVRRAKLYYLRERVGKRTRLRERRAVSARATVQPEAVVPERELAPVAV
ncbi:MAG TPA: 50S ribosomal protein L19 [Phycisphaerae bacterium]|jgi:large subunit ribosomal protein L19